MALLRFLIILLILSIPFGALTRISFAQNAFIYLNDAIVLFIFLTFLFLIFVKKYRFNNFLLKPFALFIIVALISLLLALQNLTPITSLISFSYLVRYVLYFSLIFSVSILDKKYVPSIKKAMIVSGTIFIFFGFVQYFFYPNLRNLYYLGWDEHLARFFSTFLDPNYAGAFLVLFFLFLLKIVYERLKPFKKSFIFYLSLLVVCLISIFFTYSRSAFLMLLSGVFLFLFFQKKTKLIFFFLSGLILLFLLFANTKVEEFNPLRTASSKARVAVLKDSLFLIQKNPIFGIGFNTYRYAQVRYGLRTDLGTSKSNADAGADNSFLFVLATTGIIGFLTFINIWAKVLKNCFNLIKKKEELGVLVFSSVVSLFVDSLFINSLFYPLIITWVFILIGLTDYKKQKFP